MKPAAWKYRRDYERPCRECHRPIVGAARNQRLHDQCERAGIIRRRRFREQVARASRGLFPGEKVPLEKIQTFRRRPTSKTRCHYRWKVCETPDCETRFLAGWAAKRCDDCRRRELREDYARRNRAYILRHHPQRAARLGTVVARRNAPLPAPA